MKTTMGADHDDREEISPVYAALEWPGGWPGPGRPWPLSWDTNPRARKALVTRMANKLASRRRRCYMAGERVPWR